MQEKSCDISGHYYMRIDTTCIMYCLINERECFIRTQRHVKAEGVVGIARAFLGSGARSVLVTLWPYQTKQQRN